MTGHEAVLAVLAELEKMGIDYIVTGSYASNSYGVPRSTRDADFIIEAPPERIEELLNNLKPPLKPDPQMLFEAVTMSRRWVIHLERSQFEIELFVLDKHPYDRSRFDRRILREFLPNVTAWLPTAEDVVIQKLRWYGRAKRHKDFQDACEVIGTQSPVLDWSYIEKWSAELEVIDTLAEARSAAGL